MTKLRRSVSRARGPAATIKGRAYDHIRREILNATLPVGTALSEYQLAAEIGVSRTPVREALKRLEHEGLVRSVARRGTFVADLTARDIVEVYQVRVQLEAFSAGLAAERMEAAVVTELTAELDRAEERALRGDIEPAREHDIHLHKRVIAATSNARLIQILSTLDDQVHRIRYRALNDLDRRSTMFSEHRKVLEAIRRHDVGAAEMAMREHLENARENATRLALAGTPF